MSQQFEVQLPNRPGELAHLAKALCARGVNVVQIQQSTAGDLTCARIFTDCCDDDTKEVLRSMGYPFVVGTAVTVEIEDAPCALGEVTDQLGAAGINIEGCCCLARADGRATWALSVTDESRAREILGIESDAKGAAREHG